MSTSTSTKKEKFYSSYEKKVLAIFFIIEAIFLILVKTDTISSSTYYVLLIAGFITTGALIIQNKIKKVKKDERRTEGFEVKCFIPENCEEDLTNRYNGIYLIQETRSGQATCELYKFSVSKTSEESWETWHWAYRFDKIGENVDLRNILLPQDIFSGFLSLDGYPHIVSEYYSNMPEEEIRKRMGGSGLSLMEGLSIISKKYLAFIESQDLDIRIRKYGFLWLKKRTKYMIRKIDSWSWHLDQRAEAIFKYHDIEYKVVKILF